MPANTNDGTTTSLVNCGNSVNEAPCQLSDLFSVANLFAEYVIKFFLPVVFFIGLFLTFWPIVKNPSSGEALAEAKSRLIKLLIGTGIVVGAYVIVRTVLLALGVDSGSDVLQRAVGGKPSMNIPFVERAYADYLPGPTGVTSNQNPNNKTADNSNSGKFNNPLDSVSVQSVVSGISNIIVYIGTLWVIYLYIRGGILFVMSQEKPDNLTKAKKSVFWATVIGICIFRAELIYTALVHTPNSLFK